MADIKIKGLKELQKALKDNVTLDNVKKAVLMNGDELNKRMKRKTKEVFVKGYSEGTLASNINTTITDSGFTAEVGTTAEYGEYVEKGTRFMEAEPYCAPSLAEQEQIFKRDMKRLVK